MSDYKLTSIHFPLLQASPALSGRSYASRGTEEMRRGIGMNPVFSLPFHPSAALSFSLFLSPFACLSSRLLPCLSWMDDADIPLAGFTAALGEHAEPLKTLHLYTASPLK